MIVGYGVQEFFQSILPLNTNLEELDFSYNMIESKCAAEILFCLKKNITLKRIGLVHNTSIHHKYINQIEHECKINKLIESEILSRLHKFIKGKKRAIESSNEYDLQSDFSAVGDDAPKV